MKKKLILGATLALALVAGTFTACTTNDTLTVSSTAPLAVSEAVNAPQAQQVQQLALSVEAETAKDTFVSPNITVSEALWQYDRVPAGAMPMEEAAQIGARYLWDVFGVDIDGMHVLMLYADCWMRPSAGRWTGIVYRTEEESIANVWLLGDGIAIMTPVDADVDAADRRFNFTIDSTTGERMEVASHSNAPSAPILHDTQPLWESVRGLEIQAMSDSQLADFVGLTPEQIDAYTQKATAFAEAHFESTTLKSVELGRIVGTPNGTMRLQGIQPLLDTDENGNIFGTLSGIEFTATDYDGRQVVISISVSRDSIQIW